MTISRRSLFTGLAALVAAPAIVRATSIMPVKAMPVQSLITLEATGAEFADAVTITGRDQFGRIVREIVRISDGQSFNRFTTITSIEHVVGYAESPLLRFK